VVYAHKHGAPLGCGVCGEMIGSQQS
jgi:hypothetical protein